MASTIGPVLISFSISFCAFSYSVHNLLKHHMSDHAFNLLNGADTLVKVAQGGLFPSGGMVLSTSAQRTP